MFGIHTEERCNSRTETDVAHTTFTILTTSSSPRLSFLHTRMPCLLRTEAEIRAWLECEPAAKDAKASEKIEADKINGWTKELGALLHPFGEDEKDLAW